PGVAGMRPFSPSTSLPTSYPGARRTGFASVVQYCGYACWQAHLGYGEVERGRKESQSVRGVE
ncbi:hypothetical protein V496_06581, partial [Pseudogymnoascus sp. VKM F-4515 (FW-2607)]